MTVLESSAVWIISIFSVDVVVYINDNGSSMFCLGGFLFLIQFELWLMLYYLNLIIFPETESFISFDSIRIKRFMEIYHWCADVVGPLNFVFVLVVLDVCYSVDLFVDLWGEFDNFFL